MDALFAVQTEDTDIRRLERRRAALAERARVAEVARARQEVVSRRDVVASERDELARREKRVEDEVALLEEKIAGEEQRLYHGSLTSPKEAQALQDEIASLRRRLDGLESDAIELLVETEPLDEAMAALDAELAEVDRQAGAADEALAAAEAEITASLEAARDRRAAAAAELPADVLARYERLVPTFEESTVVHFGGGNCQGCPSAMPAVEVDRVRGLPPGEITDCQECGRLVAT